MVAIQLWEITLLTSHGIKFNGFDKKKQKNFFFFLMTASILNSLKLLQSLLQLQRRRTVLDEHVKYIANEWIGTWKMESLARILRQQFLTHSWIVSDRKTIIGRKKKCSTRFVIDPKRHQRVKIICFAQHFVVVATDCHLPLNKMDALLSSGEKKNAHPPATLWA